MQKMVVFFRKFEKLICFNFEPNFPTGGLKSDISVPRRQTKDENSGFL